MKRTRLESFSDGVIAIVITLLVLSIKIPTVTYNNLPDDLITLLPSVGVYMLSFILIGMYWVFHHYTFRLIREVDGVLIWLNILFLLFISFMPFPTTLMSRYPFQSIPVVIYGINLILCNLTGFLGIIYLRRNPQLASDEFSQPAYKSQRRTYLIVNGLYIICILIAILIPGISLLFFAAIIVYLIYRSAQLMGIGKCNFGNDDAQSIANIKT